MTMGEAGDWNGKDMFILRARASNSGERSHIPIEHS